MIEVGTPVSVIGRVVSMPVHRLFRLLQREGAVPRRQITARTELIVVGQGAATMLRGDRQRWTELVDKAWAMGADIVSEIGILRALGMLPPPAVQGGMELARAAQLAGLEQDALDALVFFDVLIPHDGRLEFRDVVLAREAARLMGQGVSLFALISELGPARRRAVLGRSADFAGRRLVLGSDGRVAIRVGSALSDPDGQFLFDVPDLPKPTIDDVYAAAERAEEGDDLRLAARMYRLAAQLDPQDAIAFFNLGNVLVGLGEDAEARAMYRRAVEVDPTMADAWYNLGYRLAEAGRKHEAASAFQKAIEAEPSYANAYFNLALLHHELGSPANARILLTQYLELEPDAQPWAARARKMLRLLSVPEYG
ncbi:tetratricopeptide repeat protein [Arenibaculum pallidiluteum]|uniref:tetratricopeptide repeat protein n=1 Tax=Arenibaculum pallidiluteum TaxID=2812559 RepID=UPI001A9573F4|nr:tetratricopeptide repeat protein [Arenibaculum pallidiluteum]